LLLTLAAVIHIGDITFCPHSNTDAAVIDNEEKLEEGLLKVCGNQCDRKLF